MGFRGFEDAEIVDGPVGAPARVGPRPGVVTVNKNADGSVATVDSTGGAMTGGGSGSGSSGGSSLLPLDALQKARAVGLFVRIPFFAYLAMNSKLPGFVRIGAGLLAIWDASQIAAQSKEIEALLPPMGP